MGVFRMAERAMAMDDATWARHANPLSGYSRMVILPALTLAIWARVWLGWWALVPVATLVLWAFVNPRAFPPPDTTAAWITRGVLGERVFLNRATVPVPAHHVAWAQGLTWVAAAGVPPLAWGLHALDPGFTIAGLALTMGGKLWFLDRMVWLWQDMRDADPAYRAWDRADWR